MNAGAWVSRWTIFGFGGGSDFDTSFVRVPHWFAVLLLGVANVCVLKLPARFSLKTRSIN